MKKMIGLALTALMGVGSVACSSTSSSGVSTSEFRALFSVDVTADPTNPNTYVSANVTQGDGVSASEIKFENGDALVISSDTVPNVPIDYDGDVKIYGKTLDKQGLDWKHVNFAITRANGTAAPSSGIDIPGAVTLTGTLPPNAPYSAGAGSLALAWSNEISGAKVVYFSQPCGSVSVGATSQQKDDDGTLAIPVSELVTAAPTGTGSCVTVILRRYVTGPADPALSSKSQVSARRDDYIDVTITP